MGSDSLFKVPPHQFRHSPDLPKIPCPQGENQENLVGTLEWTLTWHPMWVDPPIEQTLMVRTDPVEQQNGMQELWPE